MRQLCAMNCDTTTVNVGKRGADQAKTWVKEEPRIKRMERMGFGYAEPFVVTFVA